MKIDDLKEWERMTPHMRNAKPDEFKRQGGWCADSRNLLAALRSLAPEIIALVEAANEEAYDHGEPSDNEPGAVITSCQCGVCIASNAFNRKLASLA